jgi:hypothetical protein
MDRLFEDFGFGRARLAPEFEHGLDQLGALEALAGLRGLKSSSGIMN